mgnify:CR=1 FL=1
MTKENLSLSEFADRLNEIMPAIARELLTKQSKELFKEKITIPQLFVLDFLYKQGESRMTDLARFMNVSTAAVTGIVDRLVNCGYAVRVNQAGDRRIIKVRLTPKANTLVRKITEQKRQMIIEVFGKISKVERQEYLRILGLVYDSLIKEKQKRKP